MVEAVADRVAGALSFGRDRPSGDSLGGNRVAALCHRWSFCAARVLGHRGDDDRRSGSARGFTPAALL